MKTQKLKLYSALAKLTLSAVAGTLLWGAASNVRADYAATVLSFNPLIYYRLNETNQLTVADVATNSGTAGAEGNAYYYNTLEGSQDTTLNAVHGVQGALAGDSDAAAQFDGQYAYVMMALPNKLNTLNPQGSFSVEAWLNPNNIGTYVPLCFANVSGLGGNANGWYIGQAGSAWSLNLYSGSGGTLAASITGGAATAGTYSHVVGVYDGTNAYLFVNGVLVNSTSAPGYVPNSSGQLTLGCRSDESGGTFFAGSIDEVALYPYALSTNQVLADYQAGTNPSPSPSYKALVLSDSPLLYYRLDEPNYNRPDSSTLPATTNLGTLGTAANGFYYPGTAPGAAGPPFAGVGGSNSVACLFNGASGCVQWGDFVTLNGGIPTNLTVTAWVYINDLEYNRGFDIIAGAGDDSWRIQRGGANASTLQWAADDFSPYDYEGVIPLDNSSWHHLVGIIGPGGMTNYVDGVLDSSDTVSGTFVAGTILASVGESLQYPGRVWNGLISEVALFPTNFTEAQVETLYNASEASPQITVQPSATPPVYVGDSLTLTVSAVGVTNLTYQWTSNSIPISGQTTTSLVLGTNLATNYSAIYAVVVSNLYGSVTSTPVSLTVLASEPIITQEPVGPPPPVYAGETVTLTVAATGSLPLHYQWTSNTVAISGKTTTSYSIPNIAVADSASYAVVVSNAYGMVTSSPPVDLTVTAGLPVILTNPAPATRYIGGNATFAVVAGGTGPDSYQWYVNSTNNPVLGATNATLTLEPLLPSDGGVYFVEIVNFVGPAQSIGADLTLLTPSNTYAAQVMELGPFTYWPLDETSGTIANDYASGLNGTNIGTINMITGNSSPGFESPHTVYNINRSGYVAFGDTVNFADDGNPSTITLWAQDTNGTVNQGGLIGKDNNSWRLAVYNDQYLEDTGSGLYPEVVGDEYFLTGPGAGISDYPPVTNVLADGNWHFIVCVLDGNDKRLYFDNALVQESNVWGSFGQSVSKVTIGENAGQSGNDFPGSLSDIALYNRALSSTEVNSLFTAATSSTAPVFGIAGQPLSQGVIAGKSVTFAVGPTGPTSLFPFTYQWSVNSNAIAGATRQYYTIPSVTTSNSGSYSVVISNVNGASMTSTQAVLTVTPLANPVSVGLVAHYTFDGNFNDSSGNNHNGTNYGSPVFVPGKFGQAIHVDVTNSASVHDFVIVGNPGDFQFDYGQQFSVSFWVNYTDTPGDLPMIGCAVNSTDNAGWVITDGDYDGAPGSLEVCFESGAGDFTAPAAYRINDGTWHHVVMTADLLNFTVVIYVDGVAVKTQTIPTFAAGSGAVNNGYSIVMGSDPSGGYQGNAPGSYNLDDVGIWRRLLTQSDVTAIYTAGQAGLNATEFTPLTISATATTLELSWSSGTLQSATNLAGPWTPVAGAVAPTYTTPLPSVPTFYLVKP